MSKLNIDEFLKKSGRDIPEGSVADDTLRYIYDLGAGGGWKFTCETGTGRTTAILSHVSERHVVFALEKSGNLGVGRETNWIRNEAVDYRLGSSQITVPSNGFSGQCLDFVLIDGPHAYPFPDLEYYYLYPHIKAGGWLVVDDVHIPTINNIFKFLLEEPMFRFDRRIGNTAFFQRTSAPVFDPHGDGWWDQAYNVNHIDDYKPISVRVKIFIKKMLGR